MGNPTSATLRLVMGGSDTVKAFGAVRPRERGEGFRIDVRPFGWIYAISGQKFETKDEADFVLGVIRADIRVGKSPEEAAARFMSPTARPNLVTHRYQDWVAFKKEQAANADLSPRTLHEYERYARPGGELAFWENRSLWDVTTASLEDWSQWLAKRGLSPKTRRNVMGALRACVGWLRSRGIFSGAVPDFPMPRVPEHRPGIITPHAQKRVLLAIPEVERGIFLALATMGLRPGEARALDAGKVRLDTRTLVVDRAMQGTASNSPIGPTKTRQYRELPLSDELLAWLERYMPTGPAAPLFVNPRTRKRWSHWGVNEAWKRACEKTNVKAKLYEGTKHTFATGAKARGIEDRSVQEYLGHADRRSTERYAKLAPGHLEKVVRR